VQGGDKLQDAYYGFQELADKYGASPLLLNGQAAALMAQGKYADAEGLLLAAQEKNSNDAETLINLVAVSQFLGKPTEVFFFLFIYFVCWFFAFIPPSVSQLDAR
jgi:coatomer protein complex subunit epsilon